EYQDTSLIQEAIIQKICRKNNLFMVGDMKQCIYHFRLAEPDIFRGKYESFAEAGPEDPEEKIDLNRNFRSRPVLLSEINRIFEPIMDGYDDNAKLHPGIPYEGEYSFSPQLYLIEKPGAEEDDEEEENPLEKPEKREMEARACAKLIKQQAGTLFEDGKTGEIRKLRYRDIVILCRSVSGNAAVYEQVMKEEGIPFYFDDSEGFFDQVEVAVFLNLLSVIDNRYQDVPLLSVLRSEIFGFSSLELAEIRARFPENSYAEAFLKMAEEGKPGVPEGEKGSEGSADTDGETRSALSEKAYNARNKLEKWKALSLALSLPDFIWRLLTESGYYMMVGAMPNGNARQANLQILAERAENFRSNSEGTLYRFVRYLETLRKRKVSTGQAKLIAENDDVVRLMTIHKSKGLEFPMVIVSGLGQKLRYGSGDSNVFFHKDVGLGLSLMDPEKHTAYPTVLMRLIQAREKQEEYEEQIRILYVAMTRAREKLYLVGVVNDAEKYLEEKELGKQGTSSYLSLLKALPTVSALRRNDLFASSEKKTDESEESSEGAPADSSSSGSSLGGHSEYFKKKAGIPLQNEVFRRLDYRYPYEDAARIRSKYSVSSINRMFQSEQEFLGEQPGGMSASPKKSVKLAEEEDPVSIASQSIGVRRPRFDVPIFLQGEKKLTQAEKGTVYHGILERIDFDRAGKEGEPYIREFSEDLVKKGVFFENELRELDLHCLSAFFESELGIRARKAYLRSALYREKSFTLRIPHKGENMMIQGIIDCFFVEEDGIVLVDYKSNSLNLKRIEEEKSRMKTAYQEQISLYRRALEKGLDCPVKESYLYLLSAGTSVRMDDPAQKQR
ncbi:MAG: 3'-5' exonuclease, partial [Eubacteriales bacterium]|nr:3'-5' exonuclease [Eubacteriales bacterium]